MLIYTLTATDFQFQNKRNDLCIISYREVINGYLQAAWRSSSKGGSFFCLLWSPFCGVFFLLLTAVQYLQPVFLKVLHSLLLWDSSNIISFCHA